MVTKPDLFSVWPDNHLDDTDMPVYEYLHYSLAAEDYKRVLEAYYLEGFETIIDTYVKKETGIKSFRELAPRAYRDATYARPSTYKMDQTYRNVSKFIDKLIRNSVWTKELVVYFLKSPLVKWETEIYVDNIITQTKNKELLRPLVKHPWLQIRKLLASRDLFLDELKLDKSKAVRQVVETRLKELGKQ